MVGSIVSPLISSTVSGKRSKFDGLVCEVKQVEWGDYQCYKEGECSLQCCSIGFEGIGSRNCQSCKCDESEDCVEAFSQNMLSHVKNSIVNMLKKILRYVSRLMGVMMNV